MSPLYNIIVAKFFGMCVLRKKNILVCVIYILRHLTITCIIKKHKVISITYLITFTNFILFNIRLGSKMGNTNCMSNVCLVSMIHQFFSFS